MNQKISKIGDVTYIYTNTYKIKIFAKNGIESFKQFPALLAQG